MAYTAQTYEIVERVRIFESRKAKLSEWDNVGDTDRFRKFIACFFTMSASVSIALSSGLLLLSPIRPVIILCAALPVRTAFCSEMFREPFEPAFISAETLCGFGWTNGASFSAPLARIGDARCGKMGIAFSAAMNPRGYNRWVSTEFIFAGRTNFEGAFHAQNRIISTAENQCLITREEADARRDELLAYETRTP